MNYAFLTHINLEEISAHSGGSDIVTKCISSSRWWDFCFILIWATKINTHVLYVQNRSVLFKEISSWLPV